MTDADLNTDPGNQETTTVIGVHDDTEESETITLTELGADDAVFFGTVRTMYGAVAGTDDDGVFNAANLPFGRSNGAVDSICHFWVIRDRQT